MKPVACTTTIQRHHPKLPRFVVVAMDVPQVFKTTGTITVAGTINGIPLGRRGLKPWGDGRWFIDLPEPLCRKGKVDVGHEVILTLEPVIDPVPIELQVVLDGDRESSQAWAQITPGRRRQLAEWVAAAKRPETRKRRTGMVCAQLRGGVR